MTKKITALAHEPNTPLEHYLQYYLSLDEPGYAVLVTGEWGTGKTHQVTKALPESHAYYVSLFGLSTPQEIEAAVFAKMFPGRARTKGFFEKFSSVSAEISEIGTFGVDKLPAALANIFIRNKVDNTKPIIFDDLERCSLFKKEEDAGSKELLGIFNRYVEHHKCRVIVIAHDEKIVTGFQEAKEKIFGQTIKIEPDVDAAFENFNTVLMNSRRQDALGALKSEVLNIFKESEHQSLRVLRHVLEDAQRLMQCVEPRHRKNHAAMVELIRLFSAYAVEFRNGTLTPSDLKDRNISRIDAYLKAKNGQGTEGVSAHSKAEDKYKSVKLSNTLLNDTVLTKMLDEGRFDSSEIQASLNASAHFLDQKEAAPWKIVINYKTLDDTIVQPALDKMNEQFRKREITESGEFLHIVALKMMMAQEGITKESVSEIVDQAKAYVDELVEQGRLPPRDRGFGWRDHFSGSHDGVRYWIDPNYQDEFTQVLDHLSRARETALEKTFTDLIPSLLDTVREDGEKFFEKICYNKDSMPEYDNIPILASINPNDFVDAWLSSPKKGWHRIGYALRQRKAATHHYPSLRPEEGWYKQVYDEIQERAKRDSGFARARIKWAAEYMGVEPSEASDA